MTNETKRNNNAKSVEMINGANVEQIANRLNELMTSGANVYNINKIVDDNGDLISYGENYDLYIIPQYDAEQKDKLSYYIVGYVPTFGALANDSQGMEYLKSQFEIRTIKRIRDNLRLAIADGRTFTLATAISDFVAVSRAGSGIGEDFKKAVAELTKALQAKFAKLPQAKLLLTQKTVLTAINNEAFAIKYLPFCVKKDGESIFGKWLEVKIDEFEKAGKPINDLRAIAETRLTATLDESETDSAESSLDDLF